VTFFSSESGCQALLCNSAFKHISQRKPLQYVARFFGAPSNQSGFIRFRSSAFFLRLATVDALRSNKPDSRGQRVALHFL
jgi:hypothetical protein